MIHEQDQLIIIIIIIVKSFLRKYVCLTKTDSY